MARNRKLRFEQCEARRLLATGLVDDAYTMDEDAALVVQPKNGVMANDTEVRHVELQTAPTNGHLVFNKNGSFGYRPNADFSGEDTFVYKDMYSDANATVTITVNPADDLAVDDAYEVVHDNALHVPKQDGVLANDGGQPTYASLLEGTTNGRIILQPRGSFTYIPGEGFAGIDTFTYVASGPNGHDVGQVTITVTNNAPVAVDDTYETNEDVELEVGLADGLTANDTDADGDWLRVELVEGPANGEIQLNGNNNGSFKYTPDPDFAGSDSFTYKVTDGVEYSNVATVSFTVNPINDAPVAVADEYYMLSVDTLNGNVLDNDYDVDDAHETLTAYNNTVPDRGTLIFNEDGSFVYEPAENPGSDYTTGFEYGVKDPSGAIMLSTVTITVYAINTRDDSFEMLENTSVYGSVAENDTFPEGFVFGLSSPPSNGEVIIAEDGSFVYTPDPDYVGPNAFVYFVDNGEVEIPIYGTVVIQVRPDEITNAIYLDAGFETSDQINEGDLEKAAAATQSMGNAILDAVANTPGILDDQVFTAQEVFDLNTYLVANYVDTDETGAPLWVDANGDAVARDLTSNNNHYYLGAWGDWHGDDAAGRLLYGNAGTAIEHGYHLIQNDGGTTTLDGAPGSYSLNYTGGDGDNLWTTVADGLFHMGNDIVFTDANGNLQFGRDEGYLEGVDYYFLNEDGNQNASLEDVADWLTYLLVY